MYGHQNGQETGEHAPGTQSEKLNAPSLLSLEKRMLWGNLAAAPPGSEEVIDEDWETTDISWKKRGSNWV